VDEPGRHAGHPQPRRVSRTVDAGTGLRLQPGESASLPPYCYHQITGRMNRVMVGEVSLVNDDDRDNRSWRKSAASRIEEDEKPLFPAAAGLCALLSAVRSGRAAADGDSCFDKRV